VSIYFTNTRAVGGNTPPFNEAVARQIPGGPNLVLSTLDEYFRGPTLDEQARGLVAFRNGYVNYRRVDFAGGVLSVYLAGNCKPSGTRYSIAQPLIATMKQFPGVLYVKVFDEYDHTRDPIGKDDSWPVCLDVVFTDTPTMTPSPTQTSTSTNTFTPVPSFTPTRTSTSTFTPVPSSTPTFTSLPTLTNTPRPTATPTATPLPTLTPTPLPTATPLPTRTPLPSPTATRTRTPLPTWTPRPTLTPTNTFTPAPTATASATLTLTPINAPTRTSPPSATVDLTCVRAEFLGDVTIVDDAVLAPAAPFTKTWRIKNSGTCTWTGAYKLAFMQGDRMGSPDSIPLPAIVAPNQTVDVSLPLIAPSTAGDYQGFWQLETPDGRHFGIGPTAAGYLWVKIQVLTSAPVTATPPTGISSSTAAPAASVVPATSSAVAGIGSPAARPTSAPVVTADFATNACGAQWQGNDGLLDCPGQDGDARGFVLPLKQADLEDGSSIQAPSILTYPSSSTDGYILGLYPQYQVSAGDHFRALVGCEQGATSCSVLFRLSYLDAFGAAHDLWTLGEFYDGHYFNLDLDLSKLAGQQVRFVLSANNLGTSIGDRALWVGPRVVRLGGGPAVPSATALAAGPTPSPTPGITLTAAPTTAIAPTPTSAASPKPLQQATPIQRFFDSIIAFFKHLLGGK
jgi:Ig-like domain-containing protein